MFMCVCVCVLGGVWSEKVMIGDVGCEEVQELVYVGFFSSVAVVR